MPRRRFVSGLSSSFSETILRGPIQMVGYAAHHRDARTKKLF